MLCESTITIIRALHSKLKSFGVRDAYVFLSMSKSTMFWKFFLIVHVKDLLLFAWLFEQLDNFWRVFHDLLFYEVDVKMPIFLGLKVFFVKLLLNRLLSSALWQP